MPEDEEARAGGLELYFKDGIPFVRIKDNEATIEANCVFKPLKEGSTEVLDDTRALYGTVTFTREKDSEPSMSGGKATPVKLISDGEVVLKGNATLKPGEKWYMMGVVGGTSAEEGKKVNVNGMIFYTGSGGRYTGFDTFNDEPGGSVPFLSSWQELEVKEGNKVTSKEKIDFKFQGLMMTVDIQNDTEYFLRPIQLQLQSTELVRNVAYDLSASNNIKDGLEKMTWVNAGKIDETGRWYISPMGLGNTFRLDPKSKAVNGNYLYDNDYVDIPEIGKAKATVVFWANVLERTAPRLANTDDEDSENNPVYAGTLPPRTGFFITADNLEAKPAWATNSGEPVAVKRPIIEGEANQSLKRFKYVLSSDMYLDGIFGTDDNYTKLKGEYADDIEMAPSMDYICVRAIQRSLKNNRGKFVRLTVKVPKRPVMPIETMAQHNVWSHNKSAGMRNLDFTDAPETGDRNYGYTQYGNYVKEFAELSESTQGYWMLPTMKQWHGLLMPGHNGDNAHNWNAVYNWLEGHKGDMGLESIELADGSVKEYYAAYRRPAKGHVNESKIYALRFFADEAKTIGSDRFSLTRYHRVKINNHELLAVQSVWLGPEYAKLYDGVYPGIRPWLDEILKNDNGAQGSMFVNMQKDMITRYLVVGQQSGSWKSSYPIRPSLPQGYNADMNGYFAGPANTISTNRARAMAFKNNTLFSGPSSSLNYDFTNYVTGGSQVIGYMRVIRRNFTEFKLSPRQ